MSIGVREDAASVLAAVAARLEPDGGGVDGLLLSVLEASQKVDPDVDGSASLGAFGQAARVDANAATNVDDGVHADVANLLRSSAVCQGRGPATTIYDEVVVLGAAARGIWRRLALLDEARVGASTLTVLAGRRPHLGRAGGGRDGDIDALLGHGGPFPEAAGWLPPARLVERRQGRGGQDGWRVAAELFPDETSLALMLVNRRHLTGSSVPGGTTRLNDGREVAGDVRAASDGFLICDGGAGRFRHLRVLDGSPVHRNTGPPRPTTISTLTAWISQGEGVEAGHRRILVVSSQPHLARVDRLLQELRAAQRLSADIEVAGCPAPADVRPGVVLRELALEAAHERREGMSH